MFKLLSKIRRLKWLMKTWCCILFLYNGLHKALKIRRDSSLTATSILSVKFFKSDDSPLRFEFANSHESSCWMGFAAYPNSVFLSVLRRRSEMLGSEEKKPRDVLFDICSKKLRDQANKSTSVVSEHRKSFEFCFS